MHQLILQLPSFNYFYTLWISFLYSLSSLLHRGCPLAIAWKKLRRDAASVERCPTFFFPSGHEQLKWDHTQCLSVTRSHLLKTLSDWISRALSHSLSHQYPTYERLSIFFTPTLLTISLFFFTAYRSNSSHFFIESHVLYHVADSHGPWFFSIIFHQLPSVFFLTTSRHKRDSLRHD